MLNQRIFSNVRKAGLSDKEAQVYTVLAESGGSFPSYIAEVTKLNRSTVYKILLDLSVKGLVNEIQKKNKLYYQVEKPQKLVRFAKGQVQLAHDRLENAEKAIPDLEGLFSLVSNKPRVLYFEGKDTILNICNDMVTGPGNYEMLAFSNAKKFKDFLPPKQLKDFIKSKERLNISTRAIIPDDDEDRTYSQIVFSGIKKHLWPKVRYVSAEQFPYEAELTIYGQNKVSITKLGGENIIGVVIEDEVIHNMMKMIFELGWKSAKE